MLRRSFVAHSSGRVNEVLQRSLLNARSHATDDDIRGESSYQELLPEVVERLRESGDLEESDGADVVFQEVGLIEMENPSNDN